MEMQVLWTGFRTQARSARIWVSDKTTGRRRCFGGRILFFPKQRPVQVEGPAIEELDAAVVGLEGPQSQTPLAQPEQICAHLFLAQALWRAPVVGGQTPYTVEVDALGSRRQPSRPHVFRHPMAQCCHRGLLCFEVRPAAQPRPTSMLTSRFTPHDTSSTAKPFSPTTVCAGSQRFRAAPHASAELGPEYAVAHSQAYRLAIQEQSYRELGDFFRLKAAIATSFLQSRARDLDSTARLRRLPALANPQTNDLLSAEPLLPPLALSQPRRSQPGE